MDKLVKRPKRLFDRIQQCYDLMQQLPDKEKAFLTRCTDIDKLYSQF